MNKPYLPKSFDDLYDQIDLVEFAMNHLGFQLDKSRTAKSIVLKKNEDHINVYYVKPNGDPWGRSAYYYNLDKSKQYNDKGFLKDLVINHCHLEFPENKNYSASKILHEYLNIPLETRKSQFKENLKEATINRRNNSVMEPVFMDDPRVRPFEYTRFLKEFRKLSDDTLQHFKSSIVDFEAPFHDGNRKFYNTGFPLYYQGKIQGFEIRNQTSKSNIKHFEGNAYGIWLSRTNFENVEKVAYAESSVDCMSHFQLNKADNLNTLYVSFGGNLYKEKLDTFKEVLNQVSIQSQAFNLEDKKLVSLTDNDSSGAMYEVELLLDLSRKDNGPHPVFKGLDSAARNEAGLFFEFLLPKETNITNNLDASTENFIQNVNKYNDYLDKNYATQNIVNSRKELYYHYIRYTKTIEKNSETYHRFIIPNNEKGLRSFAKIYARSFAQGLYNSERPKLNDWNDDLKKKELKNGNAKKGISM